MISRASSSQSVIGRVTQCLRIQQREFISRRRRRHCRSAGGHLLLHPVSQRMIYDDSTAAAADIPSRGLLFVTAFLRWMDCHKPPLFAHFCFCLHSTNMNRVMVLATSQMRVEGPNERLRGFRGARISSGLAIIQAVPLENRMGAQSLIQ